MNIIEYEWILMNIDAYYWMLLNPKNIEYGGSVLKSSYTEQLIFGIERYFSNDIKTTIELYNKEYYKKDMSQKTASVLGSICILNSVVVRYFFR